VLHLHVETNHTQKMLDLRLGGSPFVGQPSTSHAHELADSKLETSKLQRVQRGAGLITAFLCSSASGARVGA
jgi:hypothetical protein